MLELNKLPKQEELRFDSNGGRLYVVSPVSGNYKRLQDIIKYVETPNMFARNDKVIFLGNMIGEFGDSSKDCLQLIHDYSFLRPKQVHYLRGENEQRMLAPSSKFWKCDTGTAVVNSYKKIVSSYTINKPTVDVRKLSEHRRFILTTPAVAETDSYFITHGGVIPQIPLDKQDHFATIFARGSWLKKPKKMGKVVVSCKISDKYEEQEDTRLTLGYTKDLSMLAVLDDVSNKISEKIIAFN